MVKPTEIIKDGYFNAYADTNRLFAKYKNQDCVVAYRKCLMGVVMVIKGARDFIGLVFINDNVTKWSNTELHRKDLSQIMKLFNIEDKNEMVIVNQDEYGLFERKVLYNSI
jgi:hypothetical protein